MYYKRITETIKVSLSPYSFYCTVKHSPPVYALQKGKPPFLSSQRWGLYSNNKQQHPVSADFLHLPDVFLFRYSHLLITHPIPQRNGYWRKYCAQFRLSQALYLPYL